MQLEISRFKRIVVLTGAGISAESGISTFRDSGGLWERHRIEDVATPEAFIKDPALVWRFYSQRRLNAASVAPNAAHLALARFSLAAKASKTRFHLITQNVDTLHERALASVGGSPSDAKGILAMHGTLSCSRCLDCGKEYEDLNSWFTEDGRPESRPLTMSLPTSGSPRINPIKTARAPKTNIPLSPCCSSFLRPHIVWFGEMPLHMDEIAQVIQNCDLFVTIGSSGQVYPAAGLIEEAKIAGATTACLNKEPLPQQGMVDFYVKGPATQSVPSLFGFAQ